MANFPVVFVSVIRDGQVPVVIVKLVILTKKEQEKHNVSSMAQTEFVLAVVNANVVSVSVIKL